MNSETWPKKESKVSILWGAYNVPRFEPLTNADLDFGHVKTSVVCRWSQYHLAGVSVGTEFMVNNQAALQKLGGTSVEPT